MDAKPWQYNPIFNGPVAHVFIGDSMQVIHKDGSKQTLRFLAPPLPPHLIIGREGEFQALKRRLCTTNSTNQHALIGLPGIGKTTLATQLAWDSEMLKHFTGGVLWASLGPHGDPEVQLSRWAQALSVDITEKSMLDARVAQIQAALEGQPFLIVLDDVWNEEQANLLGQVTGPGCTLLLTTRDETIARTFIPPGNIIRIGELSEAQAIQLLGELCPMMREHTTQLSHLARAVGGLPLGLRLMGGYLASHITFTSEVPQALEALMQVEERLGLRDHQRRLTLQQVISLSVQALPDEKSRLAFTRLGAFAPKPASFSLTAAQEVTEANLAVLGTLVRRNLLEKVDDERVTIHQSLAEVAAASLPTGSPVIKRYADYYLSLIKDEKSLIRIRNNRLDWSLFTLEFPQIRHAWNTLPDDNPVQILEFVSAMTGVLRRQDLENELIMWLERGLRAAQTLGQEDTKAVILGEFGKAYFALGKYQVALNYFTQALALEEVQNNRAAQATTLSLLGMVYSALGEWQQALKYFTEARQLMRETASPDEWIVLYHMGRFYHEGLKDYKQSFIYMMQALSLLKAKHDGRNIAGVYRYLGGMSNRLGDHHWALQWLEKALTIQEALGNQTDSAQTLRLMGSVYQDLGNQNLAQEYHQKAQLALEVVDNPAKHAEMHDSLGVASYTRGDYQQALAHFQQALPLWEIVSDKGEKVNTLLWIGRSYKELGELQRALQSYEHALAIHDGEAERRGDIFHYMGVVYHEQEEWKKALEYYSQALSARKAVGNQETQSTTLHNMGILYSDRKEYWKALEYLVQALALRKATGWLSAERTTLLSIGVSYYNIGDWVEFERVLTRVVELSEALNHPDLELDRSQREQVRAWLRSAEM